MRCLVSGMVAITLILAFVIQRLLDYYAPYTYYTVYRTLYLAMAAIVVWVICMVWLTYKLLKKVVAYVYEL